MKDDAPLGNLIKLYCSRPGDTSGNAWDFTFDLGGITNIKGNSNYITFTYLDPKNGGFGNYHAASSSNNGISAKNLNELVRDAKERTQLPQIIKSLNSLSREQFAAALVLANPELVTPALAEVKKTHPKLLPN